MHYKKELWIQYKNQEVDLYDTKILLDILSDRQTHAPIWDDDLDLSDFNLEELPDLSGIEVAGFFNVSYNPIKTFKGSPYFIGQDYIANGTRIGLMENENSAPNSFAQGFPIRGIGGDLELVGAVVDSQYCLAEADRLVEQEKIAFLQDKVGGEVWTSRKLWEARDAISEETILLANNRSNLSPEAYEKAANELKARRLALFALSDRAVGQSIEIQDRKALKKQNSFQEKRRPKMRLRLLTKKEKQEEKSKYVKAAVQTWALGQKEVLQQALMHNNSMCPTRTKAYQLNEHKHKILLVKLFVLSEVLRLCNASGPISVQKQSLKVWNTAIQSFSRKDEMACGQGLSLDFLQKAVPALWKPTCIFFGLSSRHAKRRHDIALDRVAARQ